jgi:hypothetical protein
MVAYTTSCFIKKVVRSNMLNFITPMEATTVVKKKREGTPQI